MITAQLQGRRLALTVETGDSEESIAPFLVDPLPARVGRELSIHYLLAVEGVNLADADISADIVRAFGKANAERADTELHQAEAEVMLWAAFMWQTIGGLEAARAILEADDDGVQGSDKSRGKALALFRLRAAPLLSQIRHRLESARQTQQGATPDTDSPQGGANNDDKLNSQPSEPSTTSTHPTPPKPSPEPSPPANG